ncbi:MAG TPA: non-canonical purine NTP diphosphatase [Flavobacterium sp.]|uniref:non-canonical purine NTP diphosphatase n=1 Tax=Flavobacterium sp. TaxID=239 RepID=UPI002BCAE9A7|nr:non-canonical purine NTP diphosphatase [Flavobacterium sp.]HSD13672.1 non-canonical purine NTP diphosphatase [Flavobacterium sp.]
MLQLVFASNNKNKIKEIQQLLPDSISILSLEDIGCDVDIPETADTIEVNAILKANYVTEHYGYNCFADDSGLEIEALNGAPGVYSARFAGPQRNDNDNINKVLDLLKNETNRKANFKTVIALNLNSDQHLFTGIINGEITKAPIGSNGFGYDPIFIAEGFSDTFAQISLEEKSAISHRGRAVAQLVAFLKQ